MVLIHNIIKIRGVRLYSFDGMQIPAHIVLYQARDVFCRSHQLLFIGHYKACGGSDINIIASCDKIRSRESMDEYVMLGMRLDEGVNIRAFDERFGVSFKEKYGVLLDEYIKDGFVECDGENYRFTSNGMFVSNYILSSVLDLGVSDK